MFICRHTVIQQADNSSNKFLIGKQSKLTSSTGIDFKKSTQEIQLIIENISNVIIGKPKSVELGVVGLLSGGHVLIEDVPGVGKTILARSIAITTGCDFSRIQFTPDLLPTDVSGVSIYNQQKGNFEFKEGPIISQIVLADEINRATPNPQSAMLEAMEE